MAQRTTILDGEDTEPQREDKTGDASGEPGDANQSDDRDKDLMQDEDDTDGNV